jgi:hypothetical protein
MRNLGGYTRDRANHVLAERRGGALQSAALAAAIALVAGGCAAAWFAYRRSRLRREELAALTRWEDEGGAPNYSSVAETRARQALRACRLMSI